ncbi:GM24861 [Drosophila sechellia]|uniref:Regulatory protein zeste n=1 Tax=Drosophila sechellia TaxID=7238 RepID=B4HL58_DROSE|nr:GM24861 [Drosophila sechellia]
MSSKKTRGKKFTEQEEDVLLDLVLLNKDILRDKKMDAATWRRKTETWERLTMEFQAKTGTDRSCVALRDKYDNMKKIIRRLKKEKDIQSGVSCRCQNSTMSHNINDSPLEDQFESDAFKFFKENINDIEEIESAEYSQRVKMERLRNCSSPTAPVVSNSSRVEEEQVELLRIQQKYYKDQNVRAAEKHKYEVERELIELQTARIKNQLIEMEIKLKREQLAKVF